MSGLLLNVAVRKSTSILDLLASEDKTLLVWGYALLTLDLRLHVVNGVGRLDFQRDGPVGGQDEESTPCGPYS